MQSENKGIQLEVICFHVNHPSSGGLSNWKYECVHISWSDCFDSNVCARNFQVCTLCVCVCACVWGEIACKIFACFSFLHPVDTRAIYNHDKKNFYYKIVGVGNRTDAKVLNQNFCLSEQTKRNEYLLIFFFLFFHLIFVVQQMFAFLLLAFTVNVPAIQLFSKLWT